MNNSLNTRIAAHTTAFGLAVLVTLATLGGLNQIANAQQAAAEMAAAEPAVQQVVVVGKRAPRA